MTQSIRKEKQRKTRSSSSQPSEHASTTSQQQQQQAISFSPNLCLDDVSIAYWLKQVTIRLRREILWNWHELGIFQNSENQNFSSVALPTINDKASELLSQSRNWAKKNKFFTSDLTANYLTEQLQTNPPGINSTAIRGSFDWVINTLKLDSTSCFIFALALSVTFDSNVGYIIAACFNDPAKIYPTLSLAQKIWDHPNQILMMADPSHPLHRFGLIRYSKDSDTPNHEIDWNSPIEVPAMIATQLLFPTTPIADYLQDISPTKYKNGKNDFTITNASRVLVSRLESETCDRLRICPIRGERYSAHIEVVRGIAKITKRKIVEFKGDPRLLQDTHYLNSLATLCWLRDSDLFLDKDVVSILRRDRQQYMDITFVPLQSIPITIFIGITEKTEIDSIPNNLLLPMVDVPTLSYYEKSRSLEEDAWQESRLSK